MARFILREDTQLVRALDLHEAAKDMARALGVRGRVESAAGDYIKTGFTVGFVGKPSDDDVLIEVYAVPDGPATLSMREENTILRHALNQAAGDGADEAALEAYRTKLPARSERAP